MVQGILFVDSKHARALLHESTVATIDAINKVLWLAGDIHIWKNLQRVSVFKFLLMWDNNTMQTAEHRSEG